MGEQSAKHLRGRAMEDVIFAGSETPRPGRVRRGLADLRRPGARQRRGAGGVPWGAAGPRTSVTRRLYRDGNERVLVERRRRRRLRDVIEFFLGTGVGSKAYAIIEQGRIGFIVSSRAEDRRGLIDEAAGITKLQGQEEGGRATHGFDAPAPAARRRTSSARSSGASLAAPQAQKAERYKRYKAELKDSTSGSRRTAISVTWPRRRPSPRSSKTSARSTPRPSRRRSRAGELSVEAERLSVTEETTELAAAKDELFALSNRAQLGMQRAAHHDAEASNLVSRAEAGRREVEELTERASAQAASMEEIAGRLVEI